MKSMWKAMMIMLVLAEGGYAQNINWKSLDEEQRNIVQFNAGYDFGATAQIGYARSFTVILPVMVGFDYSFPMGSTLTDDFKVRLGGQVEVVELGGFAATLKVFSNFRRYQTQLVRIVSFGSDFALVTGYYASTWYAAGELGFDKAVTSQLKHSDIMKASFPGIRDGWYVPTGGNWYYGIQGGKTIGEVLEVTVRLGATNAQFDDENAVVPYYFQLGFNVRF
jgi:hypothetical protein